ncbi:hypothetical protein [Yinghuangia sp. YIM S09857]|uniref:hypothetical protein n=1 Tax=Yinghuangia sp. YIM S09857 TaxID=3436929 RepID=UPI003F531732
MAQAFARAVHTWDTTVDDSQQRAVLRAAPLLEPAYYALLRDVPTPEKGPGLTWREWTTHKAYSTTALIEDEHAAEGVQDALLEATRWVGVKVDIQGEGGWKAESEFHSVYVFLVRSSPDLPWQVKEYESYQ